MDLGLTGEFCTAIAHTIREQLDTHSRSLAAIRHIRGDQILHEDLRGAFQQPLSEAVRSHDVEAWTPHLEILNLLELDHREKERERNARRQKRGARNARRNAITLPEREAIRTSRTIMPRPGAKLDRPTGDVVDDVYAPPAYEVAKPFPLVPVRGLGSPPRMGSPLRRGRWKGNHDVPTLNGMSGDIGMSVVKPKLPGKRKGRPQDAPGYSQMQGDTVDGGTPPPGGAGPSLQSPLPASPATAAPGKRGLGRPPKGRLGWQSASYSQMTTHDNIIGGKWHCTSKPSHISRVWHRSPSEYTFVADCGVPEPVAVGRRKGPAGPNTLCKECGKRRSWKKTKGDCLIPS